MTRGPKFNQALARFREAFKNHQLFVDAILNDVCVLDRCVTNTLIRQPGSTQYLARLVFLLDTIFISGDVCIGAAPSYGAMAQHLSSALTWWLGDMHPDYLAAKFLSKQWDEDAAEEWVRKEIPACSEFGLALRQETLERIQRERAYEQFAFAQMWEACATDGDDWPSRDYDTTSTALLFMIHEKFCELWQKRDEKVKIDAC